MLYSTSPEFVIKFCKACVIWYGLDRATSPYSVRHHSDRSIHGFRHDATRSDIIQRDRYIDFGTMQHIHIRLDAMLCVLLAGFIEWSLGTRICATTWSQAWSTVRIEQTCICKLLLSLQIIQRLSSAGDAGYSAVLATSSVVPTSEVMSPLAESSVNWYHSHVHVNRCHW